MLGKYDKINLWLRGVAFVLTGLHILGQFSDTIQIAVGILVVGSYLCKDFKAIDSFFYTQDFFVSMLKEDSEKRIVELEFEMKQGEKSAKDLAKLKKKHEYEKDFLKRLVGKEAFSKAYKEKNPHKDLENEDEGRSYASQSRAMNWFFVEFFVILGVCVLSERLFSVVGF